MKTNTTIATNRLAGCWRYMLGVLATVLLVPSAMAGYPELPLDLGTAGDFVILAETGISTVPNSDITGDMGVSPITSTAITGFSLTMDPDGSGEFSISAQVTGRIYAADYAPPTPVKMTTAISDMGTAYTQAALRTTPDTTELNAGNISSLTITPGLHKWSTDVLINENVTLDAEGDADAIFIFQISGDLILANDKSVILAGDAQARNIFWQVAGPVGAVVGTDAHMEGVILTAKAITINTGATFNGKLLAQTRVNLHQNTGVDSDLIPPPQRSLEIISEHGDPDPMVGIYEHDHGTLLTNTVTGVETLGGTQYVNTGWSMVGNEPALGTTNYMEMAHTNDAVLTWLWDTNYLLNATANSGGMVMGDTNGFYAAGSFVTVEAVATPGNTFLYWTGDVGSSTNDAEQNLTMDQARSLVAHFEINVVVLEIISEHGVADPPVGFYTNAVDTLLTNTVTDVETLGGTQYVNTGWSMIGNDPALGSTNYMAMAHTNDAVLTWQWSTNYWLSLSATNGSITNATEGWKPAGEVYELHAVADPGYVFSHWEVNGLGAGIVSPLSVTMDGERDVVAVFVPEGVPVPGDLIWDVVWVFDARLGYYLGTLTMTNPESSMHRYGEPFGFAVESTEWHWLRHLTGIDADTGMPYVDITPEVHSLLTGIGNRDLYLDPGESVTVEGIELMGRQTPDALHMALLVTPEAADSDPDADPVAMSPCGGEVLYDRYPTFVWPEVPLATWYKLWISKNGQNYHQQWVQGTTTWTPSQAMLAGDYRWWVQPWSPSYGHGAWSEPCDFTIALMLPPELVQIAPSGTQIENTLEYRWHKDATATWYRIWVGRVGSGTFHDKWYAMTGTGEGSVSIGGHLQGDHTWWVRGWSPDGNGPWAGPMAFSTPGPAPAKPVLIAPEGLIATAEPLFEWQAADRAGWYRVYVTSSSAKVIDQWTQDTSLSSPVALSSGTHSWWVGAWNNESGATVWSDRMDFTTP